MINDGGVGKSVLKINLEHIQTNFAWRQFEDALVMQIADVVLVETAKLIIAACM